MTILTGEGCACCARACYGQRRDLESLGQDYGGRTLGNDGANKYQLSIRRGSGATVAHQVKQLTQRLIEAFEPLFVDAMPGIVHGHLLGVQKESAYIAADRSAGKLRHPLIVTRPA